MGTCGRVNRVIKRFKSPTISRISEAVCGYVDGGAGEGRRLSKWAILKEKKWEAGRREKLEEVDDDGVGALPDMAIIKIGDNVTVENGGSLVFVKKPKICVSQILEKISEFSGLIPRMEHGWSGVNKRRGGGVFE